MESLLKECRTILKPLYDLLKKEHLPLLIHYAELYTCIVLIKNKLYVVNSEGELDLL